MANDGRPAGLPGGGRCDDARLLAVGDLHVHLGGSHILQGVSFDVREGGVTALLGRNGVGKTTTLRGDPGPRPGARAASARRATSMTGPAHAPARPAGHRLRPGGPRGLRRADRGGEPPARRARRGEPRYDLVYELFPELEARAAQRAGTLSGGQQQMVAIAAGAAQRQPAAARRRADQGARAAARHRGRGGARAGRRARDRAARRAEPRRRPRASRSTSSSLDGGRVVHAAARRHELLGDAERDPAAARRPRTAVEASL